MIQKIAHLSDIHIPKSPTRHGEYKLVFNKLYKSLEKNNPDVIVIVGDLFHDNIDLQPEATALASSFLNELAKIAPVRITRGNHDLKRNNLKRMDSIEGIVTSINNPNIVYYNKTDFFIDDNIMWAVWNHGDNKSPWNKAKNLIKDENQTYIDLFHDPIYGSKNEQGYEFKSKHYVKLTDFKGDYSLFGDIHAQQMFSNETKAYSGSLIAQNYGEGDDLFHGYLLWDISKGKVKKVQIKNNYTFNNVIVNPYTDFDNLDIELDNVSKYMRIRIIWKTLPLTFNEENQTKIRKYLKDKYNVIKFSDKKEFIEDDVIDIATEELDIHNIVDQSVQHEIFTRYLEKIGVDEETIDLILELDTEISQRINVEELTNIEWKIEKIKAKNLFSYEDIEVNWGELSGLFQIVGANGHGKTTLLKTIAYILYGKTEETKNRLKYGDKRYVNYNLPVDYCEGEIVLNVSGSYYGVKRRTVVSKNKKNIINGASTTVSYYLLNGPNDEFNDDINGIEKLEEDKKNLAQKLIEKSIGTYDNFIRVVLTTSDTLNSILSNDRSQFIDSLIYDSGIDVFDLKSAALKKYISETTTVKVSCNVEKTSEEITTTKTQIKEINDNINDFEKNKIPAIVESITKGEKFLESLIARQSAINTIDQEILNLNPEDAQNEILILNNDLKSLNETKDRLERGISELKESYDSQLLEDLIKKKDEQKQLEYDLKFKNTNIEAEINKYTNDIYTINGSINLLMQSGTSKRNELNELQNSKRCPTCNQLLTEEHQQHLDVKIRDVQKTMVEIAEQINAKKLEITPIQTKIDELNVDIQQNNEKIKENNLNMETDLVKIGQLTNDKNDVEKRNGLLVELNAVPIKIESINLQILNINNKIELYNKSHNQIIENKDINKKIDLAKEKLSNYRKEKDALKDSIYNLKTKKGEYLTNISVKEKLIKDFEAQQKYDNMISIYKKCIHRDGIPTEILTTHTLPRVNKILNELLANIDFNVWLDENLVLKFSKTNRLNVEMEAISTSGMQRTFAALAFKYALIQVNAKSKPTIFLLDEIMGKLIDERVDEFIQLINIIKKDMDKLLIIEHNHNVNPDHVIKVTMDDNEISHLTFE